MTQIRTTAWCRASGRFGGFGPWRVRVLDGDRVLSTHCCWSPWAAIAYAKVLEQYWPGFRVSVRRPGPRRREAHWAAQMRPCRCCGTNTHGRDERGMPCHKSCEEAELAAEPVGVIGGGAAR